MPQTINDYLMKNFNKDNPATISLMKQNERKNNKKVKIKTEYDILCENLSKNSKKVKLNENRLKTGYEIFCENILANKKNKRTKKENVKNAENVKKYYDKNTEKLKEKAKDYYKLHSESILEKAKSKYQKIDTKTYLQKYKEFCDNLTQKRQLIK